MPMKKDFEHGTNEDGTPNPDYCEHCFQEGRFTQPDLTLVEQAKKLVRIGMEELGMTKEQAMELAAGRLPHLKRWRNK